MKHSLLGLFSAMGIIILAIAVIIGRQVLITFAPLLTILVIVVLVFALFAGLMLAIYHHLKWDELKRARYEFETRKLHPDPLTGANYPALYVDGSILQVQSGVTIQPVPAHYAPHIEYNAPGARSLETLPAIDAPAFLPELPRSLPFSAIIREVTPDHLCLGCGMNGAIFGSMTDLLSTAIIGRPGTGKTTLLRFICAQVITVGGIAEVFDPHGNIADELGDVLECAESPQEIETKAKQLDQALNTRLEERKRGRRAFPTLLVLADEWPIIAAVSSLAISMIGRIILEGRKVNMYALISGQGLPARLLGDTLARDALSSRYVFNTTPQQARMVDIDNETAKALLGVLKTDYVGKAILANATRDPEIVAIPSTSVQDIRSCIVEGSVVGKQGNSNGNGPETALQVYSGETGNVTRQTGDLPVTSAFPVGNETRETIRRMKAKGLPDREIAAYVGLSGRNYGTYQAICKEEGIK